MSKASAWDGEGNGPPVPTKKLKNDPGKAAPTAEPAVKDLCMKYTQILQSMIDYQELNGDLPNPNSPEFYQFAVQNGLTDVSQERFSSAIVFMEESYRDYVRDRDVGAHFSSQYLETRIQLSGKIWGQNGLNQDQELVDRDQNVLAVQVANQEQDVMDIVILRALIEFKNGNNGGEIPVADSVDFYEILVGSPEFHLQIPHDRLVDRILLLEENFNRVEINKIEGDTVELDDPTRLEIYNLSRLIWGHNEQDLADDDQGGADAENEGEDHEDGGVEEENNQVINDENDELHHELVGVQNAQVLCNGYDENAGDDDDDDAGFENAENHEHEQDGYVWNFARTILSCFCCWDSNFD